VIDSGYDGEVFINLHNVGTKEQVLRHGDKIAQIVMIPVISFRAYRRHDGDLYEYPISMSERGDGALGSTDIKTPMDDNIKYNDIYSHTSKSD